MLSKTIPLISVPLTLILLALAAIVAGICAPASAQTYTSFDAFPNTHTFPYEMDSAGRIVGTGAQNGAPTQDFLRNTDGSISVLGAPAADWIGFCGTNSLAGRYQDATAVEHGFVGPISGPFTSFDVAGSTGTYAWKANSGGQIVGTWTASGNLYHGFVRNSNGSITTFDVPKEAQTFPQAINTAGQVAGLVWDSAGVLHGFTGTVGGSHTVYNFPTGTQYASAHLNDAGQVTGYYADRNFTAHGYLRDTNGTFTTLNEPGQVLANAINVVGNIVGVDGGKYSGRKDGFLRRPDGTSAKIEYPGASGITSSTIPEDINQSGVIMGRYQITTSSGGDPTWHGFIVTGVH
jgi:hypothetical protein